MRTAEDDELEVQPGMRAVRLAGDTQMFVSRKAVEMLLETFDKHLRSSVQSLGKKSAYNTLEQVIKSICSSLARVEPKKVIKGWHERAWRQNCTAFDY